MHIAFLTSEYPHDKISHAAGIGTSIKNLAYSLVKKGHTVSVFIYSQNCTEEFQYNGINFYKIKHKEYTFGGWFFYRKFLQKFINSKIKKENIQLLEAPDWTGITAFINLKCPLIIRLHGSDTYFCYLEKRKQKLKNFYFEKIALKSSDYIISVSNFTAIETSKLFNIKNKISVIENGIDVEKFKISSRHLIEPNTLLYFGSIIRKKGVLELAEIFNEVHIKYPKASLKLIGKDVKDFLMQKSTKEIFIEKLSETAKLNVSFISEVSYKEIKEYIAKASVVVLPSFAEAFPMTWLEAMAMGKALITSNIGWANELMINNSTGYMINPKEHKQAADKIIELLKNDELNKTFGENARSFILTNFSQEKIVKKNIELYNAIIKKL